MRYDDPSLRLGLGWWVGFGGEGETLQYATGRVVRL